MEENKSKIKALVLSVIFVMGLVVLVGLCDFCFARQGYVHDILEVVHNGYEKESLVEQNGQEELDNTNSTGYDTLILGASHGRSAINPKYIDEALNCKCLNLCIPGETVKDSYYLLLEALKTNDVKRVIIDADYQYYLGDQAEGQFEEAFIYNQLSWTSSTKWKYLFENVNKLDFRNAISKRDVYTHSPSEIEDNIIKKVSDDCNIYNLQVQDSGGPYKGNGFFYREKTSSFYSGYMDGHAFCYDDQVDDMPAKYFDKIKEICDKKGITICAVTSPIPEKSRIEVHMDKINQTMSDFFNKKDVVYLNFNDIEGDELNTDYSNYVDAEGHMCGELAEVYSKLLSEKLAELYS